MSEYIVIRSNDHLAHYGVKGMKWGIRKQRPSSGLTRRRSSYRVTSKASKNTRSSSNNNKTNRRRKVAIGVAVAGGAILAAYGGYKIYGARVASNKRHNKALADSILQVSGDRLTSSLSNALDAKKFNYPAQTQSMLWDATYKAQGTHKATKQMAEELMKRKSRANDKQVWDTFKKMYSS